MAENGKKENIIPRPTSPKNASVVKMGQTDGSSYGTNPNVKKGKN